MGCICFFRLLSGKNLKHSFGKENEASIMKWLKDDQYFFCTIFLCWPMYYISFYVTDCGRIQNPVNGNVDQSSGTTYGRTVHFNCSVGYEIFGSKQATCMADGQWSHAAPVCRITGMNFPRLSLIIIEVTLLHSITLCLWINLVIIADLKKQERSCSIVIMRNFGQVLIYLLV
jgi:hypothetical protein